MKKIFFVLVFLAAVIALLVVSKNPKFIKFIHDQNKQAVQNNTDSNLPTQTSKLPLDTPIPTANSITINCTDNGFSPKTIKIKKDVRVIWTNNSSGIFNVSSDPHPTHTNYSPLNLGNFSINKSVSLVFDKIGTYSYHNHLNPSQKASIVVVQ